MQHNLSPLISHHITFEAHVVMIYLLAMLALLRPPVLDDEYIQQPVTDWLSVTVLLQNYGNGNGFRKRDEWTNEEKSWIDKAEFEIATLQCSKNNPNTQQAASTFSKLALYNGLHWLALKRIKANMKRNNKETTKRQSPSHKTQWIDDPSTHRFSITHCCPAVLHPSLD